MPGPGIEPFTGGMPSGRANHYRASASAAGPRAQARPGPGPGSGLGQWESGIAIDTRFSRAFSLRNQFSKTVSLVDFDCNTNIINMSYISYICHG